ncbi:IspD/TarI family cytidylyltransferase [Campylobacter porcelli]|uniref:4-diphosphocytidyl-2C-methyl-D-erythritol synthase n=1 Tax=Campylobacter porcelli TaxID=1660073 RepID=A0A1X9SYF3_9BACT|nr:IspD/TarI family cytidylyltransferase [Campylobacter sp. RM6137]ARR01149.1 4-diphosphocytidyl-2C-methyl-D-erythritol synthase [Campylobacter sp. RM6137]
MAIIGLIIAGGVGARMQQAIPKQFLTVYDKPIIAYTMEKFENHPAVDIIAVVCLDGWEHILESYAKQYKITKLKHIFPAGAVGQESIKNGIMGLTEFYNDDSIVLIHDAIRPNLSEDIISDCICSIKKNGFTVVVVPCNEAMMETYNFESSEKSFPRDNLKRTQTPQGARLGQLVELHKKAKEKGIINSVATCTLVTETGSTIYFSTGSSKNIKITTQEDIDIFKALLKQGK